MNDLQTQLYEVIYSIATSFEFDRSYKNSSVRYGFLNYIARFGLADEKYFVSPSARDVILGKTNASGEYLIRSFKKRCSDIVYEHVVPCKVVADLIMLNRASRDHIKYVLIKCGIVCIVTREEDNILRKCYKSTMPSNWDFENGTPFARYHSALTIKNKSFSTIKMKGVLVR